MPKNTGESFPSGSADWAKLCSTFIRDLLLACDTGDLANAPIDVPAPAEVVRHWISLILAGHSTGLLTKPDLWLPFKALCDKMATPDILRWFTEHISAEAPTGSAWRLFVYAGLSGDVELARTALANMAEDETSPAHSLPGRLERGALPTDFPCSWVIELYALRVRQHNSSRSYTARDWKQIATMFEPDGKPGEPSKRDSPDRSSTSAATFQLVGDRSMPEWV